MKTKLGMHGSVIVRVIGERGIRRRRFHVGVQAPCPAKPDASCNVFAGAQRSTSHSMRGLCLGGGGLARGWPHPSWVVSKMVAAVDGVGGH